jgi:hypothetical protein
MSSHITLVNVDGAAASKLSNYIAQLIGGAEASTFFGECKTLAEGQQTAGLIAKFLEKSSAIFGVENDKDVEGVFEAIVSVIFTLKEDVDSIPIIRQIAASVSSDKSTRVKLRLQILVSLFNLTAVGQSKYDVLTGELTSSEMYIALLITCISVGAPGLYCYILNDARVPISISYILSFIAHRNLQICTSYRPSRLC